MQFFKKEVFEIHGLCESSWLFVPRIRLHTVGSVDSLCKHGKILQADLVHFPTAGNLKYKFCKKTHISRPRTLYNRFSSRVARLHDLRGTDTFSLTCLKHLHVHDCLPAVFIRMNLP